MVAVDGALCPGPLRSVHVRSNFALGHDTVSAAAGNSSSGGAVNQPRTLCDRVSGERPFRRAPSGAARALAIGAPRRTCQGCGTRRGADRPGVWHLAGARPRQIVVLTTACPPGGGYGTGGWSDPM